MKDNIFFDTPRYWGDRIDNEICSLLGQLDDMWNNYVKDGVPVTTEFQVALQNCKDMLNNIISLANSGLCSLQLDTKDQIDNWKQYEAQLEAKVKEVTSTEKEKWQEMLKNI